MNIKKITQFLKENKNEEFFRTLQCTWPFTINHVQKLVRENPEAPVRDLLSQIEIQKRLRGKIAGAEQMLFTAKGAEQCSSSAVAAWNGSKFSSCKTMADLCCGIGMDLKAAASCQEKVYAVDTDEEVLLAAEYNCSQIGLKNIEFRRGRAEDFSESVEAVFIDPDRRKGDRRSVNAEEHSPSLQQILDSNQRYPHMAVKLSPLFKYREVEMPVNSTLEFVSESGTLKEVLLCTGNLSSRGIERIAVLLPAGLILENDPTITPSISVIKEYLFEPDPAIIRGGLVAELAEKIGFEMIDRRSALLTSDRRTTGEYGRLYRVEKILPYSFRKLQKYIKDNDIGRMVIKTRGFSESVESLRGRLKIKGKKETSVLIIKLGNEHKMVFLKYCIK